MPEEPSDMTPEEFIANETRYIDRRKLDAEITRVIGESGMSAVEVMFVLSALQYSIMGSVVVEDIKSEIHESLGD